MAKFNENPESLFACTTKCVELPKSTLYNVIKRIKETLTVERLSGSGQKPEPFDKNLDQELRRSFNENPRLSDRDRSRKYETTATTVRKTQLRDSLRSYRAIKQPNRNDKQKSIAKQRSRKLYDDVLTKFEGCILMDDEICVK